MAAHREGPGNQRSTGSRCAPTMFSSRNDVSRTHRNIVQCTSRDWQIEGLAEWEKAITISRALLKRPLPKGDGRVDLTGRSDPSAIIREDLASLLLDTRQCGAGRAGSTDSRTSWEQARALFEGPLFASCLNTRTSAADWPTFASKAQCSDAGGPAGSTRAASAGPARGLEIDERLAAGQPPASGGLSAARWAGLPDKARLAAGEIGPHSRGGSQPLLPEASTSPRAAGRRRAEPDWRAGLLCCCGLTGRTAIFLLGRPAGRPTRSTTSAGSVEIQDARSRESIPS